MLKNTAQYRPEGYLEDVISYSSVINRNDNNEIISIELTDENYEILKNKYRDNYQTSYNGVGTQLKKILAKIGIKTTATCSCNKYAAIMDKNGIEWCENNIDTILSWLEDEAKKRHMPFIKYAAQLVVKRAISNAKRIQKIVTNK